MRERIIDYYENYDEEGRLLRDKAHMPEYLTTIHYFDKLFVPHSTVLDVCAGTGRYAFYLADKGHEVTACDLVEHHVAMIGAHTQADRLTDIRMCDVLDLSDFDDNAFDIVLCMGAIYHLRTAEEKAQAISECVRVCKPGGIVALAYITKIGMAFINMNHALDNMGEILRILDSTDDGLFRCDSPREIATLAETKGLQTLCNVGTDGISKLLQETINSATDEDFEKYMAYMYKTCEDESILGTSLHGLYFGRKA